MCVCVQHSRICAFVCDCLFTQFVIVSSSICIWRSIWNVLDAFIFPARHFRSDVVSLAAGFSVTTAILFSCWPLSAASRRLDGRPALKLLLEDVIFVVLTWSCLLLWRGSWNLCIRLFLPPDGVAGPAVGAWVSHVLGTIGLMTLQAFNTVGLNGIDRDGSYSGGSGIFSISFMREVMPASCLVSLYFHVIVFAPWVTAGIMSCCVTSHSSQLSLLPSARQKMSTTQGTMAVLCGRGGNYKSVVAVALCHEVLWYTYLWTQ